MSSVINDARAFNMGLEFYTTMPLSGFKHIEMIDRNMTTAKVIMFLD